MMTKRTGKTKIGHDRGLRTHPTNNPFMQLQRKVDGAVRRIGKLEKQIIALQVVLRNVIDKVKDIDEDVEGLWGEEPEGDE